jgi:hypothetical protein
MKRELKEKLAMGIQQLDEGRGKDFGSFLTKVSKKYSKRKSGIKRKKDWWDSLPSKVKTEIDEALAELDKGKGIPHEVVLKKYGKWF